MSAFLTLSSCFMRPPSHLLRVRASSCDCQLLQLLRILVVMVASSMLAATISWNLPQQQHVWHASQLRVPCSPLRLRLLLPLPQRPNSSSVSTCLSPSRPRPILSHVTTADHPAASSTPPLLQPPPCSILCLSNGHGEDSIAASVLTQLLALGEKSGVDLQIEALPLVGEGHAYRQRGIVTLGPAKTMPSGGFIYMDLLQLIGDLRAGLLALTLAQCGAVTRWVDRNPDGVLLAVGDVFPLILAWLASQRLRRVSSVNNPTSSSGFFAFIGTAKSEFYMRGGDGTRLRSTSLKHLEFLLFSGSVYYPWERAMMSDSRCRLVVPRDDLTAQYLRKHLPQSDVTKVQSLGNPMMDDLDPTGGLSFLANYEPAKFIAVLPGSRAPEIYSNWKQLLVVAQEVSSSYSQDKLVFLVPLVTALEPGLFIEALLDALWQPHALRLHVENVRDSKSAWAYDVQTLQRVLMGESQTWPANNGVALAAFEKENALFILIRGNFNDVAYWAEAGIAMAGTATEQLVGKGKPVFTIPGQGPQFTAAFAEAQSRLLGESVILQPNGKELARSMKVVMSNSDQLLQIAKNGCIRMGQAGASRRISEQFWKQMLTRTL